MCIYKKIRFLVLVMGLILTNCTLYRPPQSNRSELIISTANVTITPTDGHDIHLTSTPLPVPRNLLEETPYPSPTPTPHIYQIREGDMLTSIAHKFGIRLHSLISANPSIDPDFLSIGTDITIPPRNDLQEDQKVESSLDFLKVICFPQPASNGTCVATVHNPSEIHLTDVRIEFNVVDSDDKLFKAVAYNPLNFFLGNSTLPFSVIIPEEHFPIRGVNLSPISTIRTDKPLSMQEMRTLFTSEISLDKDNHLATISINLLDNLQMSDYQSINFLAFAESRDGIIIGYAQTHNESFCDPDSIDAANSCKATLTILSSIFPIYNVVVVPEFIK